MNNLSINNFTLEDFLAQNTSFSNNSKIWIYQSTRPFSASEISEIAPILHNFVSTWTTHGQQLKANANIIYQQFIVFIVDDSLTNISGCGVDKSVHCIQQIEQKFNILLLDRMRVAYFNNQKAIETIHINEIANAYNNSQLTNQSLIFNNNVQTLTELKNNWLIKFENSWCKKLYC